MTLARAPSEDALLHLRAYRKLAPFGLRDLATISAAILEASEVRPINSAANTRPTERTIRFYVSQRLVARPDGRGTAAVYSYRHLLQVLTIKLRQMEGATLMVISKELDETTGDILERRVAAAFGARLPAPDQLTIRRREQPSLGRAGRAFRSTQNPDAETNAPTIWRRIRIADEVELHVDEAGELARLDQDDEIADAVRVAISRVVTQAGHTE